MIVFNNVSKLITFVSVLQKSTPISSGRSLLHVRRSPRSQFVELGCRSYVTATTADPRLLLAPQGTQKPRRNFKPT